MAADGVGARELLVDNWVISLEVNSEIHDEIIIWSRLFHPGFLAVLFQLAIGVVLLFFGAIQGARRWLIQLDISYARESPTTNCIACSGAGRNLRFPPLIIQIPFIDC